MYSQCLRLCFFAFSLCSIASKLVLCSIANNMRAAPGGVWADKSGSAAFASTVVDLNAYRGKLPFNFKAFPTVPSALPRWHAAKAAKWMVQRAFDMDYDDLLLPYLAALPQLNPVGQREEVMLPFGCQVVYRYSFDVARPRVDLSALLTINPRCL